MPVFFTNDDLISILVLKGRQEIKVKYYCIYLYLKSLKINFTSVNKRQCDYDATSQNGIKWATDGVKINDKIFP